MDSLWSDGVIMPAFPQLKKDITTDALVIGGGIAGILCAYALKEAGVNTVLVEANTICSGNTGRTTAKITSQHGPIYHKLLRKFGPEKAGLYYKCNQSAIAKYKALCQSLDCDFQEQDAFVYATNNTALIEQELQALHTIGATADFVNTLPLPFHTVGAIRFKEQAQFHPLKFLASIAKDLKIYEHTRVLELMPGSARTSHGKIQAKAIISSTHFPFINKHGSYFLKLYQDRSYVLALKNAQIPEGMYIGAEEPNLSFRSYKDLLLLGGCGHRTGKHGGGWQDLAYYAHRYYPQASCAYRWAAQDCMPLDHMPYIGQYSKNTPGLYVISGFQKWGMTSAMAAADIVKDLIIEQENPYTELFSPSRSILHTQLAVNGFESALYLINPRKPRCPHLGCALKWNSQEHSWDCSCHGSRFTEDGHLLDGPANSSKALGKHPKY